MSEVIDRLLEKYPVYKDVNREALIDAVGRKYPVYLEHSDFKEEFDSLQALNKSVQETPAPAVVPTPEPSVPASQAFDRLFAKPTPAAPATMPETTASPLTEGAAAQADILRTGVSHGTAILGDTSDKPIVSLPKPEIFDSDPDRLKVAKGMATAISSGLESVLTERGLEAIAVAGPMAPLVFGTLGAVGTVKGSIDIANAKTPEERGRAIGETFLNAGMAALSYKSGVRAKAAEVLAPKTAEAANAVIKEGAPNAEQISSTAPLHGDVLNEPGPKEGTWQMPPAESSVGVSPRGQGEALRGSEEGLTAQREAVTHSTDTPVGQNATGEQLYERQDGSRYRMRTDRADKPGGYPDFGGDLAPVAPAEQMGPGAARPADVGLGESNIDPLQRVSDAVKTLPAEPKVPLHEQLEDWVSKMAEGTKDNFERAIGTARAGAAWVKNNIMSVPKVEDLDRTVGKWSLADQELSHNSRLFAKAVKEKFPSPDTLNALTNYIEAEGNAAVLAERAAASKAQYKKGYEDALKLTEDQKRLADEVKYYFEQRLQQAIKAGALEGGVENYIHRFYEADSPQANSILAEINSGKFRTNFEGFKKRFYATDFEAEQAGLKPVKNLATRILHYDQGFNRALSARAFVKEAYKLKADDGRPVIATAGMGDRIIDKESGDVSAYMVKPHALKGGDSPLDYRGDYVAFDHPAFRKWVWATSDAKGAPVMVEGGLKVHPEYARKFRALFDRSLFSRHKVGRAILVPSAVVKQTMLSISAFHPVQITTHALEHKVSPFKLTEINFKDPKQAELIEGGLMVADHHASQLFSEGVGGVGLTEKIPLLGERLTAANDWLFKDYIPQVKMSMALHALERNLTRYDKDIKAGKVTREQMVRLTARESNAAFGEQNYRAMFRHPTFQDMLRVMFLAPDFGEARIRFPAQAATKYGGEQRMALALGAVGLWSIARIANKAANDDFEWKHLFSLMYKGHEYSLRNVAADIWKLMTEPGTYTRNRLNPIYTRAIVEFVTGKDTFGRPRDSLEQLQDEAQTIIPISFRSDKERYWWESFLGAIGITNRRFTAETQVREFVKTFNDAQGKKPQIQFIGESDYHQLHRALESGDLSRAEKELTKLETLKKAPDILEYFRNYPRRPFTGSKANDQKLLESLSQHERKVFTDAIEERKLIASRFLEVWRNHSKEKKP